VTVGDMWEKGQITSAHEHYTTQVLKTRISMIFYSLPSNGLLPKAIAVCGPNETHEVGLLVFTLFLRRKGFEVIYLGSSIEDKDVELIVKEVDPTFLFMSCTMLENAEKTLNLTNQMIKKFPHLKVGLGGYVFDGLDSKRKGEAQPFILGNTKEEWNSWLTKKLAEID
jgi:MerR family transcriptional regulator, light-induced transcriptional regulator